MIGVCGHWQIATDGVLASILFVQTSQIAFPEDVNSAVYASGVCAAKGRNPTRTDRDRVFSDGFTSELATLTGNTASGYNATFQVGITV